MPVPTLGACVVSQDLKTGPPAGFLFGYLNDVSAYDDIGKLLWGMINCKCVFFKCDFAWIIVIPSFS
jgi:hypothetical protein